MKYLFMEAPIPRRVRDGDWEVVIADTAPMRLLSLAERAKAAGHKVDFHPASADWSIARADADRSVDYSLSRKILAHGSDVIFLDINHYNHPLALRLISMIGAHCGDNAPKIIFERDSKSRGFAAIVLNGHTEEVNSLWEGLNAQECGVKDPYSSKGSGNDAIKQSGGNEASAIAVSPTWIDQLSKWPRWERAVQSSESFGFPLLNQPHPWNTPLQPMAALSTNWLSRIGDGLPVLREPHVWLSNIGILNRDTLGLLGEFSLNYIKQHGAAPIYSIRATPDQFDITNALDNLAVLNMARLELLVGTGANSSLARYHAGYTLEQVIRCARKINKVGLANRTRLSFVLGMPDEQMNEAIETIEFATRTAVENSIAEIKFEWWLNVSGSQFYKSDYGSMGPTEGSVGVIGDPEILSRIPASITMNDRQVLQSSIDLLREFHSKLPVLGPDLI